MKNLMKLVLIGKESALENILPEREQYLLDRFMHDIERGRFERSLSGLTAFAAVLVAAEVYYEHYSGSFGNKFMWTPVVATPPVVASGIAGIFSRRAAKTWLPLSSAIYMAVGVAGLFFHVRGVARKPGGWREATYNVVMGPPPVAPGLFSMVGSMGLLAALLRQEK